MDRKDFMPMSGTPSYNYLQRGMHELRGQHGMHPSSNSTTGFLQNVGGSSGSPGLMVDPSAVIAPDGVNPAFVSVTVPMKRKRGRPRKYGTDGPASLALSPSSSTSHGMLSQSQKRGRGRPPGTGRKQQSSSTGEWTSGSAGIGFTPHVITVAPGEDIAANIMAFAQQGSRAVCILSANGAVSTVTLRQQSSSGGTVTYEGRFDILCMSGSFLLMDNDGSRGRAGGLSISLASPDGRVIGGGVGGMLIAASPVQVILGTFISGGTKTKSKQGEETELRGDASNAMGSASIQQNQTPTSSMSGWPSSHGVDMQNSHFDIDLMRG
ncbi:hypothetical protein Droror1_Dr00000506 [Drosera rotundifolia]